MLGGLAISAAFVLVVSSCGSGGGGSDGAQVAPVGLEDLVFSTAGLKFTFGDAGRVDFVKVGGGIEVIDGFAMTWPDNLIGATYTYSVSGSKTAVVRITVPGSGVDWTSILSNGGGFIEVSKMQIGNVYAGIEEGLGFSPNIDPFVIEIAMTFDTQGSVQITSIVSDIKCDGLHYFAANPIRTENVAADGRVGAATLLKIDGSRPEVGYDPDKNAPPKQPSDKTDGKFDKDSVILDPGELTELKYNFTAASYWSPGTDPEAPITEEGIAQVLWNPDSQADYSLVQLFGTYDVIMTLTNDSQGHGDEVITLHFQGDGASGTYESTSGRSGLFEFIENL